MFPFLYCAVSDLSDLLFSQEWKASWNATLYKAPKGIALIISYVACSYCLFGTSLIPIRPAQTMELPCGSHLSAFHRSNCSWLYSSPQAFGGYSTHLSADGRSSSEISRSQCISNCQRRGQRDDRFVGCTTHTLSYDSSLSPDYVFLQRPWDHIFYTGNGK